jgi:DNA-directed RNA polymerase specialized sigma24 family protein
MGVQEGKFSRRADRRLLWPLLVAITAHKCVDLARREGRRAARELPPAEALLAEGPTPAFAAQLNDELERLLGMLDASGDSDLRRIALSKLEGATTMETAAELGCVRRTVERKLQLIARIWQREGT